MAKSKKEWTFTDDDIMDPDPYVDTEDGRIVIAMQSLLMADTGHILLYLTPVPASQLDVTSAVSRRAQRLPVEALGRLSGTNPWRAAKLAKIGIVAKRAASVI
jgi:hypothetical protein